LHLSVLFRELEELSGIIEMQEDTREGMWLSGYVSGYCLILRRFTSARVWIDTVAATKTEAAS